MNQRLDFYKSRPEAIKAMIGLGQRIGKSSLERELVELVRLREVWQAVEPHFTAEEITDLTLLVVAINGWNRFSIAFRKMPA